MKKIVAFVLPVPAEGLPKEPNAIGDAGAEQPVSVSSENSIGEGVMKFETTVSNSRAQRVIATLLEQDDDSGRESNLEQLLEKAIDGAGPEARDLFKRIVIGIERELVCRVYSECNGVKTRAAARLGINRNTLHKKLRRHHLADD